MIILLVIVIDNVCGSILWCSLTK